MVGVFAKGIARSRSTLEAKLQNILYLESKTLVESGHLQSVCTRKRQAWWSLLFIAVDGSLSGRLRSGLKSLMDKEVAIGFFSADR